MNFRYLATRLIQTGKEIYHSIDSRHVPRAHLDESQEENKRTKQELQDVTEVLQVKSETLQNTSEALEYTTEALHDKSRALDEHIVGRIGLERKIEKQDRKILEQTNLLGHQKVTIRKLKSHNYKDLRAIFNEKPYKRSAMALVENGEVYFHNRSAVKLTRGRFRREDLSDQIPFDNLEKDKYEVKIHGQRYNAFPTELPSGVYMLILKKPGIFQSLSNKEKHSPKEIMKKIEVARARAEAEVAKREARLRTGRA
jgi:hypothetical protein